MATVTVVHTALGSRKKHGSSRAPSLLLSLSRALNRFTSELRVDQESGTSKLRFLSFQVSFPMIAGVEAALCASDTKTSGALLSSVSVLRNKYGQFRDWQSTGLIFL
jgi:hypothetical protein